MPTLTRSLTLVAAWFSVGVACAPAARADVVFNSFGPADAVDPGGSGFSLSGGLQFVLAVRFVPATSTRVTRVMAHLRSVGGNGFSSLYTAIVPETAGLPGGGAVWTSSAVTFTPAGETGQFTSATPATLNAGQAYWLVIDGTVSMGNAAVAHAGLPPSLGSFAQRAGPAAIWNRTDNTTIPAVRIEGESVGACCNPATGGCVVLSASTCTAIGLRFDGLGSTCAPATCRACPGDFNRSGSKTSQDVFDFLAAYFSACP